MVSALLAGCGPADPVVAKVGGLKITQSEFRRKLSDVSEGYQSYVLTPTGRRQFLDILIREKMILAAAMRSGVARSAPYKAEFSKLKAEEDDRLRQAKEYLLAKLWVDELRHKGVLGMSADEVTQYHRQHPVEVSVRHILLSNAEEAGVVAKKIREGANFSAAARSKSLDAATAADGGRMPPAVYGEIIPDLEEVVFRMRLGEISGPIKSKFGYHILRKDSEKTLPLEAARERIARILEKQKLDHYLQSMEGKLPVEVIDDQFK